MKHLILSVIIYLSVFNISVVNANQTANSAKIPNNSNDSVNVAGFFNDILQGITDLNNTIRGVRSTINEVNRLQDELDGKNTENSPNNLSNPPILAPQQPQYQQSPTENQQLTPQQNTEFPTNQQPQYQQSPPVNPAPAITSPNP
jgi:hypothetical protein